ncbi:hypothetical protein M426DRAFT_315881 [Hypoxylon sp. CI-4A]|nr:hypothetical protein M426DRAFT_315881 [Hypoxylon sp. CI-4A]
MASTNGGAFSETLQEVTNTKLEELSRRRSDFETTKSNILSMLANEADPSRRLYILSQGVKASYALKLGKYKRVHNPSQSRNPALELELKNLDSFLTQAKYDPSVSSKMMRTWEESLFRHLDMQSLKYQYASLYAQLVTEWLSTEKSRGSEETDVAMTEGFEDVAGVMKQEARQQWEGTVFEAAKIDQEALVSYLNKLFSVHDRETPTKLKALNQLRSKVTEFEDRLFMPNQFNAAALRQAADGLLSSDLLSDEKREVLRDFKSNSVILGEIADVLNMRITALDSWTWGTSVPLEQRRQITGVYNVVMHENLIQALFLQHIGTKWSVFLKGVFHAFRKTNGAWQSGTKQIPDIDEKRRGFYLGEEKARSHSVQAVRNRVYRKHYFMANLLDHESQRTEAIEGEEEAEFQAAPAQQPSASGPNGAALFGTTNTMGARPGLFGAVSQQVSGYRPSGAPPPPPPARKGLGAGVPKRHRKIAVNQPEDDEDGGTDLEGDEDSTRKRPMQMKQRLLRLLSTEIAINTKLYGEFTAFHSMFERWNTLLPHETILTIMSFLGVSTTWLDFFRKFLRAPLKFLDDDASTSPRDRSRGTPASHVLSDVFGESILFCLDFAVNQSTGGSVLYRMKDDFWFWSRDHGAAVTAWKSVTEFVNATGTYIDNSKTGTVRISRDPSVSLDIDRSLPIGDIRWGFLKLSPKSGKFEIDQQMVDKHIIDMRKQLQDKKKSIISFIQAWNTYAATFFTSNFGKAANCFGKDHVAQMLATHKRIQRKVFSASSSLGSSSATHENATNIVDYLKNLMYERFGISDIPDAYLFFPVQLGGLDLKSPFVSILQVHDTVLEDPSKVLEKFFESEKEEYNSRKADFEKGAIDRWTLPAPHWRPDSKSDQDNFMSFNEYIRYREDLEYDFEYDLYDAYKELLKVPKEQSIQTEDGKLANGIKSLAQQGNLKGIHGNWSTMEPYWRWIAQLYGPEVIDRFGGLNLVEPGLLPMAMVSIFRDKRVTWQG